MKTTIAILAAGLVIGLAGCAGDVDRPVIPQASELSQPATQPAAEPPAPFPPSENEVEAAKEIARRLPSGPADPRYREPAVGWASPDLTIVSVGGLNLRPWPTRTFAYPNGQVEHMPLWFADPMETTAEYGRCGDLYPAVYSPLRFVGNLIGLPVTMYVHRLCEPTVTDRTPVFAPATQPQ